MTAPPNSSRPQSFRLYRGRSDLWVLPFGIAFGIVMIVSPEIGSWLMRWLSGMGMIVFGVYLTRIRWLRLVRKHHTDYSRWTWLGVSMVTGPMWIYVICTSLQRLDWLDGGIALVWLCEIEYWLWLKL